MSVKNSFMHYMKWTRVTLPEVSAEFELVCMLLLFFSFHYHCQLVKSQLQQKSGWGAAAPWFLRACCWLKFCNLYMK